MTNEVLEIGLEFEHYDDVEKGEVKIRWRIFFSLFEIFLTEDLFIWQKNGTMIFEVASKVHIFELKGEILSTCYIIVKGF